MRRWVEWLAVAGNIVFVLWVAFNGMNEGFRGTPPQIVSWVALSALLVLDSVLILSRRER